MAPRWLAVASLTLILALILAAPGAACAGDQSLAGTRLRLKRRAADERLVLNDPGIVAPAAGSADDPRVAGMRIVLFGQSVPGEVQELIVPPGGGWTQRLAPRLRYRFQNLDAPLPPSPVRFVRVRHGRGLKIVARAAGLALWGSQLSIGVRVEMGSTRFCAVFAGDSVRRDEAGLFAARGAPNPGLTECADEELFRPACELGPWSGCNAPTVLVASLDSGDWRYMDPLIDGGYLPSLGAIREAGVSAHTSCVNANPGFGCFCPIVHVSAMTGWPSAVHGILGIPQPSTDRRKPAVWNVLRRHKPNAQIALAGMRNTWPPEADATYVLTEPGNLIIAEQEFYDLCTPGTTAAEITWPGVLSQPETWTKPPDLFTALGLIPDSEPDVPYFVAHGAGFTAMAGLTALTASRDPGDFKLTAFTLHFPDKTKHIICGSVHDEPFGDINGAKIVAEAATWSGPWHPCPWGWGSTASAYLEADVLLSNLLAAGRWDYVVTYSDHGMTLYPPGQRSVPCQHGLRTVAGQSASFGVRGPGVREGVRLPAVQDVLCVAPLVAYLLNLPVSQELPCVASGAFETLLGDVFTPEFLAARPPSYVAQW
jgi:hypothetical protein